MSTKKARIIRRRLRFGPTIAKFFALIILTVLAILMLTNSSSNATQLYQKSDTIKDKADLEQQIDDLQFWISRQKTLQSITNTGLKDQMEPIQNPDYLDQNEGNVAGENVENR